MSELKDISWIAADWGTSNLRVWALDQNGNIVKTINQGKGMSALLPNEFEPYFMGLIGKWLPEKADIKYPVVICGMAGAKTGWKEASYMEVPCSPVNPDQTTLVQTIDQRISVRILPGIMQASPSDVMRGEETQIAGYLSKKPNFDGVICLPGTHTKWVHISAGEIISFRTFMTGEIFQLLSEYSILKNSVKSDKMDTDSFLQAFDDAYSKPALLSSKLFGLRATDLLENIPTKMLKAKLSGYLIGSELAGSKSYWLGRDIVMIGNDSLCALYEKALKKLGLNISLENTQDITLNGLKQAYFNR